MTPEQAADALRRFRARLDEAVLAGVKKATERAAGLAVPDLQARGRHSNVMGDPGRTRLWQTVRSLEPVAVVPGHRWRGGLAAGGEGVPYARIQEFGGTTKPHVIEPKNAKALVFEWAKKGPGSFFFARVNHPGSNIPARPYLRPAIERVLHEGFIQKDIGQAVLKVARQELRHGR